MPLIEETLTRNVRGRHLRIRYRPELAEQSVVEEVIDKDCYRLRQMRLVGTKVVDCGAHIGVFSLACVAHGADRVFAIEPQPLNRALLETNVGQYPQILIRGHAVGDHAGETLIARPSGGAHTLNVDAETEEDISTVEMMPLAAVLEEVGLPIYLLKLDMEGGEAPAITSVPHDILRGVQRIVLETHGPDICPWTGHATVGEIIEYLLYTHQIDAAGYPNVLGYVHAERYQGA